MHGYAPFSGLPELKEAVAHRYRTVYGVELDPAREVAIVPGIKATLAEFPLCVVERGSTLLLPDPGYPDYLSGAALAAARIGAAADRATARLRRGTRRCRRRLSQLPL